LRRSGPPVLPALGPQAQVASGPGRPDVVRGTSRLVTAGPGRLFDGLPYPHRADGTLDAPGVASRKKQLPPASPAVLEVQ
jgi:hypothetical protein